MHGIEAVDHGAGVKVGMRGEFDAYSLPDLREALDHVCAFGKPVWWTSPGSRSSTCSPPASSWCGP